MIFNKGYHGRKREDLRFLPFLLMLCTGISISSIDMYLPALPELAEFFKTTANVLRVSIMISPFISAFAGLFYGSMSDKYGRRPIILFCLFIFSIGSLWCAFSNSATEFLIARSVQAMGSTGMGLQTITVISDKFKGITLARYLSIYSVLYPTTYAVAPNIGAFLMLYMSWRGIFYFLTLAGSGLMLFLYVILPETLNMKSVTQQQKISISGWFLDVRRMFRTKPIFRNMALTNALASIMNNIFITNSPFIFEQHFCLTKTQFANLSIIPHSFNIIGCLVYSFLLKSRSPKSCLNLGRIVTLLFMIFTVIALCIPDALQIVTVVTLYCICAFGMSFLAMTSVGFAVSDIQANKGLANGVVQFVRNISSSFAVMLVGYFCAGSVSQVFFAMSACAFAVVMTISTCYQRLPDMA
ncbi:MAG: MFS transporter [Holosporales bacterium]|jgi:DHA1 family bicyclomycin/chloramphenicol resistance-like MFS transporter|nr:MFS transporter [Holosporales bacterium]